MEILFKKTFPKFKTNIFFDLVSISVENEKEIDNVNKCF